MSPSGRKKEEGWPCGLSFFEKCVFRENDLQEIVSQADCYPLLGCSHQTAAGVMPVGLLEVPHLPASRGQADQDLMRFFRPAGLANLKFQERMMRHVEMGAVCALAPVPGQFARIAGVLSVADEKSPVPFSPQARGEADGGFFPPKSIQMDVKVPRIAVPAPADFRFTSGPVHPGRKRLGFVPVRKSADENEPLGSAGRRDAERDEAHACHPRGEDAELPGGAPGQIDDSSLDERPAVVDPHVDAVPVVEPLDAHPGAERQRPVRGGEGIHVERLAVRGFSSVKGVAVPGGVSSKVAGGNRYGNARGRIGGECTPSQPNENEADKNGSRKMPEFSRKHGRCRELKAHARLDIIGRLKIPIAWFVAATGEA